VQERSARHRLAARAEAERRAQLEATAEIEEALAREQHERRELAAVRPLRVGMMASQKNMGMLRDLSQLLL
jgi:hypothetical protein